MEITFIGQQSWLISSDTTNVLIDPVLTETFGTSPEIQFRIYPPRKVDISRLPNISGIIITNEHLDHFHVKTLTLLNKDIPLYLGKNMPFCVKETISKMGYTIFEFDNFEVTNIGTLSVRMCIGNTEVPFFEKRVYQLILSDMKDSVLIQSDTLISDFLLDKIKENEIQGPNICISTNNAQVLQKGEFGAFSNLLPISQHESQGLIGINIYQSILTQACQHLSNVKHVLLSGGGYIIDNENSLPFMFTENERVEKYINELSLSPKFHYPYPGESIIFVNGEFITKYRTDWISLLSDLHKSMVARKTTKLDKTVLHAPIFLKDNNDIYLNTNMDIVYEELSILARIIMTSEFGQILISNNDYIAGALSDLRFVINFKIEADRDLFFALSLNECRFKQIQLNQNEMLTKFPFGIQLYLVDFIAILTGKIQIWELATSNMRQWYLGGKQNSPVLFLYNYFSEQVRPDLAYKVYDEITSR